MKMNAWLAVVYLCTHHTVGQTFWGFPLTGHVCTYVEYEKQRSTYDCGFWGWRECSRYKQVSRTMRKCCDGWKSIRGSCALALCDGKTNYNGACNRNEGYVKYTNGSIVQNSGGQCKEPNVCVNCNEGYYSAGPYCRACTKIDNCNIPSCTRSGDTTCTRCDGEYAQDISGYGRYAYTRFLDGSKTCKKACSWRKGSRCYPGNCSDTTTASCTCVDGFSGPDCDQITQESAIPDKFLKLIDDLEIVEAPPNRTEGDGQATTWTNMKPRNALKANLILNGVFNPELLKYKHPQYVNKSVVGIIYGKVQLELYRGGNKISVAYVHECNPGDIDPKPTNLACERNFTLNDWPTFVHQDRIQFTVVAKNGGRVTIKNFDRTGEMEHYLLHGLETHYSFEIVFDYKEPTHCTEDSENLCTKESLIVPDVTNSSSLKVTWDGWHDTDAGIGKYEIEVFQLIPDGKISETTKLKYGDKVLGTPGPFNSSVSEANISLGPVGVYAVLLIAVDRAGNKKSTRRILIFDNISVVEKMNNPLKVTSASKETKYEWITKSCQSVHVEWYNRFANKKHEGNGWLNSVEKVYNVDSVLDDNEGERQINRKDNVHGIVRFDVGYEIIYESNIKYITFKSIPDIHFESADLKEDIIDGKRLVIHVRAYDIMGKFSEDTVNVTIDTSPPVIENLWLTRGDRVNISVSGVREFTNLTIEWLAYDFHSGIDYVRWRLYDNYTGHTIVHGLNHLSPQGETAEKKLRTNGQKEKRCILDSI